MQFESLPNQGRLPKIGFGTSGIGGRLLADRARETNSMAALRAALELGCIHFDTAEMYASGHAEELLGRAIQQSGIDRRGLFITSKVQPMHLRYGSVLKACEGSLRRLGTDYLDLYLVHWPNPIIPLKDTFRALNQLVRQGKVRHLGVSNFNVNLLRQARELSETPILTDQVPYSLADRSYVRNGVLEFCQREHILLTAYSPVERGHLHVNDTMRNMAAIHKITPHQLALAWLVAQPSVIAIPMSLNRAHIVENLAAADIQLSPTEMQQLQELR